MLARLRKRVTDLEGQLRAYNAFRRGAGGTTNRERDEIRTQLDEAKKALQDELDNPTPREAPERARASRETGRRERRLDAEFAARTTGPEDDRGDQIDDVLERAFGKKHSNQAQLYREAQALWLSLIHI